MAELPSGSLTFLFSDIEGSTRLWEDHPVEMESALKRHDEILRGEIARHGGYIFATGGDGYASAFSLAHEAVAAAVDAQRRLQTEPWNEATPILVRMGLHTGKARERGGDFFGPTVNRAARITAATHGGQIVVSQTTHVSGDHWRDVTFTDLGEHMLRDLADSEHIWQVCHEDLSPVFPTLRSLDRHTHNLPTRVEPLVGREHELQDLTELVHGSRLVTLVGPGGMGKTRLSIEVAAGLVDHWDDGVWFVDLVPAEDNVDSVAEAIGNAMGFDARYGQSWSATVVAALTVRSVLLVFDNCEHVLDAAIDIICRLLEHADGVRILATTRERLDLPEERLYPLGSLDAGPELFVSRATTLDPQFDGAASQAAVKEICRRLDGLPLGIELAAARVRSLQPEEIVARLDHRFRILRTRDRTVDRRHQTLAATVDWSFHQLPKDARDLFCRLGVFGGGFDLTAACGVADPALDELEVADLLDELEAKSLITANRSVDSTRYRLLETMAAFAQSRLEDSALLDETYHRHARMRAAVSTDRSRALDDPDRDGAGAFKQLMSDVNDIEAAFNWASRNDPAAAEEIFVAVRNLTVSGAINMSTARDFAEEILRLWDRGECSSLSAATACLVLTVNGGAEAADVTARGLLGRDDLDGPTRAFALIVAAWGENILRDDSEKGGALAEEAISISTTISDVQLLALARMSAVIQLLQAGHYESAINAVLENDQLQGLSSLRHAKLMLLHASGSILRHYDLDRSTRNLEEGARLAADFGSKQYQTWVRYHMALNRLAQRDPGAAAADLAAVLPGLLDRGDPLILGQGFADLANALYRLGDLLGAVTGYSIADAALVSQGATGDDAYVQRRDRHLERLERQLGADAFAIAWSEGQALTVDQAVRHMRSLAEAQLVSAL